MIILTVSWQFLSEIRFNIFMSLGLNMVFFIWKVLLHFISSCPNNSILFQSKKFVTITQQCKTCRVIISIGLGNGLAFTRFQATTWSNDHYAYIQFSLFISFIPMTVTEYIISYAIHHSFQPSYIYHHSLYIHLISLITHFGNLIPFTTCNSYRWPFKVHISHHSWR